MTYDLSLRFKRPLPAEQLGDYLTRRGNYSSGADGSGYSNEETGVYFTLQPLRHHLPFAGRRVSGLRFELNYGRPSYFAREADIELGALTTEFDVTIEDPQMHGMGRGPYASDGFLRGWKFGNEFFVSGRLKEGEIRRHYTLPGDVLSRVWKWNYGRRDRAALSVDGQFVPLVRVAAIEGRACLTTVWGEAIPTILPAVDYVFLGKFVDGERRFGLASWAEVTEAVASAGIPTDRAPLDINYETPPERIARWFGDATPFDVGSVALIEPEQLLDDEAVLGGQRFLDAKLKVSSVPLGPR